MAPPLRAGRHPQRTLRMFLVFLMVRVIGRINGLQEPAVMLDTDTISHDPLLARQQLITCVEAAAAELGTEILCAQRARM